jgi:hypothetical protein
MRTDSPASAGLSAIEALLWIAQVSRELGAGPGLSDHAPGRPGSSSWGVTIVVLYDLPLGGYLDQLFKLFKLVIVERF